MINVNEIRKGAGRVYKLAPNPATFLTLTWAALATTDELIASWDGCSNAVKLETIGWRKSALAYRAALVNLRDAARAVIDHAATGDPDWQAGIAKGTTYAFALRQFFNGPEALSGGWAVAANALERFGCEPPPDPRVDAARDGAKWLVSILGGPFGSATLEATDYVVRNGGDLATMGEDAKKAVDTYFTQPLAYLEKATNVAVTVAVIAAAAWFGWPILSGLISRGRGREAA